MLINKTAWSALGGFREAYECDLDYSCRLHHCGFEQYIIPSLYVYHACGQDSIFDDARGFDRRYILNESGHIEILRQSELRTSRIRGILHNQHPLNIPTRIKGK